MCRFHRKTLKPVIKLNQTWLHPHPHLHPLLFHTFSIVLFLGESANLQADVRLIQGLNAPIMFCAYLRLLCYCADEMEGKAMLIILGERRALGIFGYLVIKRF